ncbi:MAG: DNA polymerase I, partial [Muribaculaceae bacterium]|nr:DNA polymerase I [Muribaculaceae bacterium]
MDDKKLFLLDAYALIYRAYYALIRAPRVTSKGLNTSAIYGFCNTLDEILKKENPSHIAVCFDPPHGVTFRHEVYPEYKAQRDAQPEDITLSIPYIKRIIEAYNIPVVEIPGFEADDVIGTLARRAQAEGYTTFMMTPDKDYGQLVTDHTFMYRPSLKGQGFEIRGPQEVCDRYGIDSPRQVIDLLALEGDVSDNVPGCPGVGEKTASKLIKEWGSVENLLEHVDDLKGALQKKIRENAEQIKFSKFLVTIKTDVPVDITVDSLERKPENVDALREIYKELEFRTFLSRLDKSSETNVPQVIPSVMGSLFDDPVPPGSVSNQSEDNGTVIKVAVLDSPVAVGKAIERLTAKKVGLFMNAKGAESMTAVPDGIALSEGNGQAVYIPVPENVNERKELMSLIEPLFNERSTVIISHDVKRDLLLLKREGVNVTCAYEDTGVQRYILDPERRHKSPEGGVSPESAAQYAASALSSNADLSERIEADGLSALYRDIELPMVRVLARMEWNGVRIDTQELGKLSLQLTEQLHELEAEAYQLAGTKFNLSSPMQVGEVLFERLKIDPNAKRTKRGAYSTTEEILEKYRTSHPVVDIILKVRGLRKLLTTYINALPQLINPATGKIHTTYNQTVTATGRLSSTNPNLQNIP